MSGIMSLADAQYIYIVNWFTVTLHSRFSMQTQLYCTAQTGNCDTLIHSQSSVLNAEQRQLIVKDPAVVL